MATIDALGSQVAASQATLTLACDTIAGDASAAVDDHAKTSKHVQTSLANLYAQLSGAAAQLSQAIRSSLDDQHVPAVHDRIRQLNESIVSH